MAKNRPGKKQRAPSPYSKYDKKPAIYSTTPLNKPNEGQRVTDGSIETFTRRLGL